MVDNLQLELLSAQFSGELMPQAHIEMCSIIDISNPYLTVNPPRLPLPVHRVFCILELSVRPVKKITAAGNVKVPPLLLIPPCLE